MSSRVLNSSGKAISHEDFCYSHRFFIAAISLWLRLNSSSTITTTQAQARAYVTDTCNNAVPVIDTDTNKVVATVPVGFRPGGLAITPDGARVYATIQPVTATSVGCLTQIAITPVPRTKMIVRMAATGSSAGSRSPIRGSALSMPGSR